MNLQSTVTSAVLLCLQTAGAVMISVTDAGDSGPGTLRSAIANANNGDTIRFALVTPATINLTSGELVVSKGVSILGPGPSNLVLDAGHWSRIFHIVASTEVSISGLTLINGHTTSPDAPGGGLDNLAASLTLSNCVVASNDAYRGGGIWNGARLQVISTVLENNMTPFGDGNFPTGNGGAIFNTGRLQLINSFVKNNRAFEHGGGVSNLKGTALITNCTFTGNSSFVGGAIANNSYEPGATANVFIVGTMISGNVATLGAGLDNFAYAGGGTAALVLIQSSVSSNAVETLDGIGRGGGIENQASEASLAQIAIIDSTIEGNVAPEGGGIENYSGWTEVGITNSTISGNAAFCPPGVCVGPEEGGGSEGGGAIFSSAGTGSVCVVNSTLAENTSAQYGTGIYAPNTAGTLMVLVASSIFETGTSNRPILLIGSSRFTSLGYNICSDSGNGYLTNATDQINTAPLLGPLQDNGGPTLTHAPLPGSPAIDQGRNFSGSITDQRGLARAVDIAGIPNASGGDGTDIGAVESPAPGVHLINPGFVAGQFGFNLMGPFSTVVIEVSDSLNNWTAAVTNALTDAPLRFTDSSPEASHRFYRARLQ